MENWEQNIPEPHNNVYEETSRLSANTEADLTPTEPRNQTKQEVLKQYEISINFLDRGCIIRVGCKSFAFSDPTNGMVALENYIDNPEKEIEKWLKVLNE